MTVHDNSPDPDSIINAYLDGYATPEQVAEVESSPDLLARANELGDIKAQIGATVQAPDHIRERILANALAASNTAPNVTSITTERGSSPRRTRQTATWIASAAAVVIAVVVGGSIFDRDGEPDVAAPPNTTIDTTEPPVFADPGEDPPPGDNADEPSYVYDFGAVGTDDEIVAALDAVEAEFDLGANGLDLSLCTSAVEDVLAESQTIIYLAVAFPPGSISQIYGIADDPTATRASEIIIVRADSTACEISSRNER